MSPVEEPRAAEIPAGWAALIEAIRSERTVAVEETLLRLRGLSSYRGLGDDELRDGIATRVDLVLDGLAARRPPGLAADERDSEAYGENRARGGVTLTDLLTGWRFGFDALYRLARDLAPPSAGRDRLLLDLVELMLQWVDAASVAMAAGHRRGELDRARELQHVHGNLTRRMLDGIASPAEIRTGLGALGLEPEAECLAVRARPGPEAESVDIERYLGVDGLHGRRNGLMTLIDGDLCGFVRHPLPRMPAPTAIGVSEPASPFALKEPFRRATRALETATAFRSKGVFAFESLAMQAAIVSDPDVGAVLRARYLEPLAQGPSGPAILRTAELYLDNDGSVDATARALGVHANTVRKRLDRFEDLTGRSLREGETAIELWWALQSEQLAGSRLAETTAHARRWDLPTRRQP